MTDIPNTVRDLNQKKERITVNLIEKKTACVTGATSGIGAAFAEKFAKQGYDLIITGRRKEKIESLSNMYVPYHVLTGEDSP